MPQGGLVFSAGQESMRLELKRVTSELRTCRYDTRCAFPCSLPRFSVLSPILCSSLGRQYDSRLRNSHVHILISDIATLLFGHSPQLSHFIGYTPFSSSLSLFFNKGLYHMGICGVFRFFRFYLIFPLSLLYPGFRLGVKRVTT